MWSFLLFAYPRLIRVRLDYEIFGIIEKKQRFSTGLQEWNIFCKSVFSYVCVEKPVEYQQNWNIREQESRKQCCEASPDPFDQRKLPSQ